MATCKDCLHFDVCLLGAGVNGATGTCPNYKDKSEWVNLPCKEGDALERNGELCDVDHWNVIATAFTKDGKLRLFNVEEAKKALRDMKKEDEEMKKK